MKLLSRYVSALQRYLTYSSKDLPIMLFDLYAYKLDNKKLIKNSR